MKKRITQVLALLFAAIMLFSLAACADPGESEITTEETPVASSQIDVETTSLYKEDNLGTLDFNTTIGVLAWADVEHFEFNDEIGIEASVSDQILTKLGARIATVEKRLGIKIEFTAINGDTDYVNSWNSYVEKAMTGGDHSFDVLASYSLSIAKNAASGFCYDLLDDECHYLEFDQPWWSELLIDTATVSGKLFFASGDISRNALEMMYVCYVNTDILTDHNLENPQDFVASGDWTYEKFIEMCNGIYQDDGDGIKNCTKESGDTFGYITSGIHVDPWYYGTGATIVDKDVDGKLIPSESWNSEKLTNTIEMLNKLLWDTDDGIYTSSVVHQAAFGQGRSLFMMDRARVSHKVLKADYDVDYLIVPCPKYDKDEEKYITVMGNPFTLYAIRKDAVNVEAAAAFIECMASEGYRQVTPTVFELQLKTRYVDDPVSGQMYDLIRSNLTYDLGRLYSNNLVGQKTFRGPISSNSNSWATTAKNTVKLLKSKIKDIQAVYDAD